MSKGNAINDSIYDLATQMRQIADDLFIVIEEMDTWLEKKNSKKKSKGLKKESQTLKSG